MFYIIDNQKSVQAIEKITGGIKVWYSDNTSEIIELSGGSGGSNINVIDNLESTSTTDALSANQGKILNDKIPKKTITKLAEDTMNDGIGIWWSNGDYERMYIKNTPTVKKCLYKIEGLNDGTVKQYKIDNLNGSGTYANAYMYSIYNAILGDDGVLSLKRGNRTQIDIDFNKIVANSINTLNNVKNYENVNPISYYKTVDNNKIEITEEEFNNMPSIIKYYKTVDGIEIEITEEEFNNI